MERKPKTPEQFAEQFYEEAFYNKDYDQKHGLLNTKQKVVKIMLAFLKQQEEVRKEKLSTFTADKVLLDIAVDVENEIKVQATKAGLDDLQEDTIRENVVAVFDINKRKYLLALATITNQEK